MRIRNLKYPGSKWEKHKALQENEALAPILPASTIYHKAALQDYFLEFPIIYIKPVLGSGGANVIRIEKNEEQVIVKTKSVARHFKNEAKAVSYVNKLTQGKRYLLQQGVDMLEIGRSAVDFRVLLLKQHGAWHWYGIIGKKGKPGSAVTNRARGGVAIRFADAAREGLNLSDEDINELMQTIQNYSMMIAHTLNHYFPKINQLGLDVAIDKACGIYLIEANTKPHFQLFRNHEDRRLYAKVSRAVHRLRHKQVKAKLRKKRTAASRR